MAEGPGKLCGTIKLDGNHVWNGFRTIEDLASSLESYISDWQIALIHIMKSSVWLDYFEPQIKTQ